jgi:hypothetical protein
MIIPHHKPSAKLACTRSHIKWGWKRWFPCGRFDILFQSNIHLRLRWRKPVTWTDTGLARPKYLLNQENFTDKGIHYPRLQDYWSSFCSFQLYTSSEEPFRFVHPSLWSLSHFYRRWSAHVYQSYIWSWQALVNLPNRTIQPPSCQYKSLDFAWRFCTFSSKQLKTQHTAPIHPSKYVWPFDRYNFSITKHVVIANFYIIAEIFSK